MRVDAIHSAMDRERAKAFAGKLDARLEDSMARELHYPYHAFVVRSTAATLFGESVLTMRCLVDGRTGLASTSDPFDVALKEVPREDVLEEIVKPSPARTALDRYLPHLLQKKRRSLLPQRLEILERRLVHKPFWVLRGDGLAVLLDGVTEQVWLL